ncbi:MAG TPA: hypothetical protein VHV30_01340 [Polyangiaceae bacterium]|jgi:hypothetical protein|nr:hypothetical protein [Polyangiaceae bacterium]
MKVLAIAPAAVLAAALAGCGTPAGTKYTLDVGGDDAGDPAFAGGDAAAGQELDAYIEQGTVAVKLVTLRCAGACATVQAVATGGNPPYAYRWDDGSTNPIRTVCPSTDTSFAVDVVDTAGGGEVPRPAEKARTAVTAEVLTCPDASIADGGEPIPETDACTDAILNPSFEGTPQTQNLTTWDAPYWQKCAGSPAEITGPSSTAADPFGPKTISPTDGQTALYIQPGFGAFLPGPGGAGEALCAPVPAGGTLSFRIDALTVLVESDGGPTSQTFQVYGGNTACCDAAGCGSAASPLLYASPPLSTTWATYCVTLTPSASTGSLTFAAGGAATSQSADVVLDNIVPVTHCP